jgi:NAD(P)H-flavin reductase
MLSAKLKNQGVETHELVGAQNSASHLAVTQVSGYNSQYLESQKNTGVSPNINAGGRSYTHMATDDGSMGYHGFNTELLPDLLAKHPIDYIATCGPEPMQKIVAKLAAEAGIA